MSEFLSTYLVNPIVNGRIPHLPLIKQILIFLSIIPMAGIFIFPESFRSLGEISWQILLFILFIRPLSEIFTDLKIFRGLMPLRKELGILCGSFAVAHSIGYFLNGNITLPSGFLDSEIWNISDYYFWGMIGFIIALILTLTSNIFSIKILKRYWKKLHRLTYIFFFVIIIHIVLIRAFNEGTFMAFEVWNSVLPALALIVLWGVSFAKIKIPILTLFINKKP